MKNTPERDIDKMTIQELLKTDVVQRVIRRYLLENFKELDYNAFKNSFERLLNKGPITHKERDTLSSFFDHKELISYGDALLNKNPLKQIVMKSEVRIGYFDKNHPLVQIETQDKNERNTLSSQYFIKNIVALGMVANYKKLLKVDEILEYHKNPDNKEMLVGGVKDGIANIYLMKG